MAPTHPLKKERTDRFLEALARLSLERGLPAQFFLSDLLPGVPSTPASKIAQGLCPCKLDLNGRKATAKYTPASPLTNQKRAIITVTYDKELAP